MVFQYCKNKGHDILENHMQHYCYILIWTYLQSQWEILACTPPIHIACIKKCTLEQHTLQEMNSIKAYSLGPNLIVKFHSDFMFS